MTRELTRLQNKVLSQEQITAETDKIMKAPAFEKLLSAEGADKVADRAVQGMDRLHEGLMKTLRSPQKEKRPTVVRENVKTGQELGDK